MSPHPAHALNRLAQETSPYLRQHATNPVAWFPWGDAALAKATSENKPIFLSIGYAACHWCHVMERESFTNAAVADILNTHFVSIKVDREERPDLDAHFMEMAVAMTGQGGWPLNLFLTPGLAPLYAGTYFPPEPRYGYPAFAAVAAGVGQQWQERGEELARRSDALHTQLFGTPQPWENLSSAPPANAPAALAADFWRSRYDSRHGGFGDAPKFPQPSVLSALLRHTALSGKAGSAAMVHHTLEKMAAGGLRDQLGGMFHRYATDAHWHIPHFEIMLYDNAGLARVYLEAYQMTGRSRYATVVRAVLDDLLERLTLPDGSFASSLDADTQGEEGRYYTWTPAEIDAVLGQARGRAFREAFLDPTSNQVEGRDVLHFQGEPEKLAEALQGFAPEREKLRQARQARPAPALDDKALTSWNAMAIRALAKAGVVLKEPRYLEAAQRAMATLLEYARTEQGLIHSRAGTSRGEVVFLEDYAFTVQALLDLYEAELKPERLVLARQMGEEMLKRFQPKPGAPLQNVPLDQPAQVPPRVELEDHAMASAHGAALAALARLALMSGEESLEEAVAGMRRTLEPTLETLAPAASELLWAWDLDPAVAREVVLAGPADDPTVQRFLELYRGRFLPHATLVLVEPGWKPDPKGWPSLSGRVMLGGKPTAYVCRERVCLKPVTQPGEFLERLEEP